MHPRYRLTLDPHSISGPRPRARGCTRGRHFVNSNFVVLGRLAGATSLYSHSSYANSRAWSTVISPAATIAISRRIASVMSPWV
jgi:hypothetical protein